MYRLPDVSARIGARTDSRGTDDKPVVGYVVLKNPKAVPIEFCTLKSKAMLYPIAGDNTNLEYVERKDRVGTVRPVPVKAPVIAVCTVVRNPNTEYCPGGMVMVRTVPLMLRLNVLLRLVIP